MPISYNLDVLSRYLLLFLLLNIVYLSSSGQTSIKELGEAFEYYWDKGDYDSTMIFARVLNKEALNVQGDSSIYYIRTTRYFGNYHFYNFQIDSAGYYWRKAADLYSEYHPEDPDLPIALTNLGIYYSDVGDFSSSVESINQAMDIWESDGKEESLKYGKAYSSLGVAYYFLDDLYQAEFCYKEALRIVSKNVGEEHPNCAAILNNLGLLYIDLGDFKSSEKVLFQAREIIRNAVGEEHFDYSTVLATLASLYSGMNNLELSTEYNRKSLAIIEASHGKLVPDYAIRLNNLGNDLRNSKQYREAESCYLEALEVYRLNFGEHHPMYSNTLFNLAILYDEMNDTASAEKCFLGSLAIYKDFVSDENERYLERENRYGLMLFKTGRRNEAYAIFRKNSELKSDIIVKNFEWLNDYQKEAYWKSQVEFYDGISEFARNTYLEIPEAAGMNYNTSLRSKSLLLEARISKENYFYEIDEIREQLRVKRKYLIKLESDGSEDLELIQRLSSEADSLDKLLTLTWPAYAEQKKNLQVTWEEVQKNLDPNEAVIEFVRFRGARDSIYYYHALLLRKNDPWPMLVPLCDEDQIRSLQPQMGFIQYYQCIWQPLEKYLEGIHTIYYSPVGELTNISFNGMIMNGSEGQEVDESTDTLRGVGTLQQKMHMLEDPIYLADRYTLHQLTSTRYLAMGLKGVSNQKIDPSILMVGGVNYDYLPENPSKSVKPKKMRKADSKRDVSIAGRLEFLDGTLKEVEAISRTVQAEHWDMLLLEQDDATEENVVKHEGKQAPGVLHIATHGYAFPAGDLTNTDLAVNSFKYTYRFHPDPMIRSGLILAGGNWTWTGSDTLASLGAAQNGILTALEVSHLNLRNTRLVVLSACETGLGKVEDNEGTFGLKRGFKLAGVEQIIVSLWKVPDSETKELMDLFYQDLVKTHDPVLSFQSAQLLMRDRYPSRPDLWAGFVLVR